MGRGGRRRAAEVPPYRGGVAMPGMMGAVAVTRPRGARKGARRGRRACGEGQEGRLPRPVGWGGSGDIADAPLAATHQR
eukprot:scaffold23547_cov129-Isochrysis_galbana.AAC.2